jgi:hypothetical protein
MAEARRLYAAKWTIAQIVRIIQAEHGLNVNRDTVKTWVVPEFAEAKRARRARNHRLKYANDALWVFNLGGPKATPEYRAAFCRRLRAEGEPIEGIARVCRVVFSDQSWTATRVKAALGEVGASSDRPRLVAA